MTHAFKTAGFLYLKNYNIAPAKVENTFSHSAKFFKRPQSQKDSLRWTTARSNRGYVTTGREKTTQLTDKAAVEALKLQNPDLKESMEIGREGVEGMPNQWPSHIDAEGEEFKKVMLDFFETCKGLHIEVMRAIALGMGLDIGFFDEYTDGGDNTLRLLHYQGVKKEVFLKNQGQVRAGEHSDYGTCTALILSISMLLKDERKLIWRRQYNTSLPRHPWWSPSRLTSRYLGERNAYSWYSGRECRRSPCEVVERSDRIHSAPCRRAPTVA
jgi:isopenicillin N synthase-like dioxygenase